MKTGLVLEGGALRTIFSSGACDALLDGDLMPDYVVGVSAGIAYGVSYISRQKRRNLHILTNYANDKRYMGPKNLLEPDNRCYFGLKFTYETIPNELIPFDYETFAAYPGQVEAVVTNLDTGCPEYLPVPRRDEKFLVLQATCAMPLLFPIFYLDNRPYLDGGASDAIPYDRAFRMGCERVVVILTRERSYRREPERLQHLIDLRYHKYPRFCETMRRRAETYNADRAEFPNFCDTMEARAERYNDSRERLFRLEEEGKVLLIAPEDTQGFSRTEKDVGKIMKLWKDGYDHTLSRLDEIRAFWQG